MYHILLFLYSAVQCQSSVYVYNHTNIQYFELPVWYSVRLYKTLSKKIIPPPFFFIFYLLSLFLNVDDYNNAMIHQI